MSLKSQMIDGPTGPLELLSSLPTITTTTPPPPPLLFLHGLSCSAHCYQNFLPYLARRGYAAYALSLRDHGASHRQSWLARTLGTTLHGWGRDVEAAIAHVAAAHPDAPAPVLGGHSLGGGLAQWLVSAGGSTAAAGSRPSPVSALVLLGSAPLRGGGREILGHWQAVEAATAKQDGGEPAPHWLWGARCRLQTPAQVRAAFFSDATSDAAVDAWLRGCRSATGNARASAAILWPFGDAARVLAHLPGLLGPRRGGSASARKVLCVAGSADRLVPPAMVLDNYRAYQAADVIAQADGNGGGGGDDTAEACSFLTVEGSGHHLMIDAHWEECADGIVQWLSGQAPVKV